MRPILKEISSDHHDLHNFVPKQTDCFGLTVRMRIGIDGSQGADDFELFVCTPEWMCKNIWEPSWGRHMLIVRNFDLISIKSFVEDYLVQCEGDEWNLIATKIARVLAWEFEDYQP